MVFGIMNHYTDGLGMRIFRVPLFRVLTALSGSVGPPRWCTQLCYQRNPETRYKKPQFACRGGSRTALTLEDLAPHVVSEGPCWRLHGRIHLDEAVAADGVL